MVLELRQQLKLSQQLVMTPQLQMAIKLLQLSRLELMDTIRQELEENPALEEQESAVEDESAVENQTAELSETVDKDFASSTKEVIIEERIPDETDWNNYINEYNSTGKIYLEIEGKDSPKFESFIAQKESLNKHLLWQLLMTSPTEEQERIGSFIIGNLNKDGYLDVSVEEIAAESGSEREKVEHVLALVQTFDPIGVGARSLSECLLIQVRHLGISDTRVTEIITNHLKFLENKNYKAISRALKASIEDVVCAVKIIKCLEPKPGREFSGEEPQYITPDIFVHKMEDNFVIMLNDDGMPKLRVNTFFKNTISRGKKISGSTKEYLQEKMRSAAWLIRSIHQRQKTIYKVMESIMGFQRDFFENGIAHLKPMVLKDVAEDIDMHESTVSRVTTNKYVYTPQGIFELKYFFNSSINRFHGEAIASASVQEKIKKIIESEDPKKPFSDDRISKFLKESNIDIARRTVAKYREIMRILPSNKRRQF